VGAHSLINTIGVSPDKFKIGDTYNHESNFRLHSELCSVTDTVETKSQLKTRFKPLVNGPSSSLCLIKRPNVNVQDGRDKSES
jgi:hypothetical protein